MPDDVPVTDERAEQIRQAVIDAFTHAYEDAAVRGLCAEGCLEAAVQAARQVDVRAGGRAEER